MSAQPDLREQVRDFYDSIGWKQIGEGVYQNARHEDLREVSREYIHRCHLRVESHLPSRGSYLLDAGSGPIQYPEYLEYSQGYRYRVCLDISARALVEARERIGQHGLFVVGDMAKLPFANEAFQGLVSLHAVHHLPPDEQRPAFLEFSRVLQPAGRAVVVYSWGKRSPLMGLARPLVSLAFKAIRLYRRARWGEVVPSKVPAVGGLRPDAAALAHAGKSYTYKHDYSWFSQSLDDLGGLDIRVWRSVNTAFLRALVHPRLFGKLLLRLLFWLEDRAPHFFGRYGQHPMILFSKPAKMTSSAERLDR